MTEQSIDIKYGNKIYSALLMGMMGDNNWNELRSADELEYSLLWGVGGGKWAKMGTDDGGWQKLIWYRVSCWGVEEKSIDI